MQIWQIKITTHKKIESCTVVVVVVVVLPLPKTVIYVAIVQLVAAFISPLPRPQLACAAHKNKD